MPHLAKLAESYKGKVTFLALSDEEISTVKPFLAQKSTVEGKTWGEAMAFTVATDPDKSVKNEIFTAAGQRGIPSSFIISDGKIQWIGHPMSMDGPLEQIVAGTWDLEAARKEHAKKRAAQAEMSKLRGILREARESGDWAKAMEALDKAIEKSPDSSDLQYQKWSILLIEMGRSGEAYTYGDKVVSKHWDDPMLLNQIAWTVVDDRRVKTRDLKFALRVAKRAAELTDHEDGAILDTLARAYYESGQLSQAIEWQRKAVKYSEGQMKSELEKVLDKYEAERGKKKGTDL